MISRILSFTLATAWIVAAIPAYAYDPSDPSGPPPDDPSAYLNERGPARVGQNLKRCDMMFAYDPSGLTADDPSAYKTERGLECSCDMRACAQLKGSPRSEGKAKQLHNTRGADEFDPAAEPVG